MKYIQFLTDTDGNDKNDIVPITLEGYCYIFYFDKDGKYRYIDVAEVGKMFKYFEEKK